MSFIKLFAKKIDVLPRTIQFAKDRKYEEAWIINRTDNSPTNVEIDNYLNDKFDLLIVEYIWYKPDQPSPFVLTIFLDEKCKLQDRKEFIERCLDYFYNYKDFNRFVESYNDEIIGYQSLLASSIKGIRLGVFNYWMSVGPIDLWDAGEELNLHQIKDKIKVRDDVERTKLNFQSLLFIFNTDKKSGYPFHGIKVPSCKKVGEFWEVDYGRIDYWVNKLMRM